MNVAIVNYGIGNLASVRRALEDLGATPILAAEPGALSGCDRIVLPGVGAFAEGMKGLARGGWVAALRDAAGRGTPLLGICLGMQLLGTASDEGDTVEGLDLIPGRVRRLDSLGCTLRIPHVGWNEVAYRQSDRWFCAIPDGSDFYFVHSYALVPNREADVLATTPYGGDIVAAVRHQHVFGCQFHPEKSSRAGRQLLRNFLDYPAC